jgi:HAD superfamily hydrolase (TIGR01509 family)
MTFSLAAVIFDMDGLMLDTEPLSMLAWGRALAEYGYTLTDQVFLELIGRTTEDTHAILRQALAADLPFEHIFQRKKQVLKDIIAQRGVAAKAGLLELLTWLESRCVATAVASSARREDVSDKLAQAGLSQRFNAIVTGDQVHYGKPAPDIFLAAALQLHVPAQKCLVLEDSEAGIQAAHAAGMWPVMVPDLKLPSPENAVLAYRIFPSLREVQAFLEHEAIVNLC